MKYIVSFGGSERGKNRHNESYGIHRNYTAEVRRLFKSAEPYGFDGYWEYNNDWIYNSAYWQTDAKKVLEQPSFGWAFKPIAIYESIQMMNDGDHLLWVDSNDVLIRDPQPLFEFANENGIYFHDHHPAYYPNSDWTTKDMFVKMCCDSERYWRTPQIQVNIVAFVKNEFTKNFCEEWVKYAIDYDTIIANNMPNYPGHREPRHEQSIASILREKYGIPYAQGYPHHIAREEMGIAL